jgi:hypothetical protein
LPLPSARVAPVGASRESGTASRDAPSSRRSRTRAGALPDVVLGHLSVTAFATGFRVASRRHQGIRCSAAPQPAPVVLGAPIRRSGECATTVVDEVLAIASAGERRCRGVCSRTNLDVDGSTLSPHRPGAAGRRRNGAPRGGEVVAGTVGAGTTGLERQPRTG